MNANVLPIYYMLFVLVTNFDTYGYLEYQFRFNNELVCMSQVIDDIPLESCLFLATQMLYMLEFCIIVIYYHELF